jgi:CheY-like chemotaxis protein
MSTDDPLRQTDAPPPGGLLRADRPTAERDRLQHAVNQVHGLSGNLRLMLDSLLPIEGDSPVAGAVTALLNRLEQGLDEVVVLSRLQGTDPDGLAVQPSHEAGVSRVLLVDGCDDMRRSVGGRLREEGYEVLTACDAQQGMQLLQHTPCMALVLDVEIPFRAGLGGLASCARALPVIVMAGSPSSADSRRALSLGAVACLPKDGRVSDEILSCLRIIQEPSRILSPS